MFLTLVPHPDNPPPFPASLEACARSEGEGLIRLEYRLAGPLDGIVIPEPAQPARADELWTTTCFELFLIAEGDTGYLEFNLSPSSRWAAYRFGAYRSDRRNLELAEPPRIDLRHSERGLTLTALLRLDDIPPHSSIGLSAVLDHGSFGKSFWAIRHPAGRPDFHHRDCFAARLDAAKAT